MLLAGSEFLQGGDFNDWKALDWENADQFAGIVLAHKHLLALRRNQYGDSAGLASGEFKVIFQDDGNKVLAYRRGGDESDPVMVIASFNEKKIEGYKIENLAGDWKVRFNSSWKGYSVDFSELKVDFINNETMLDLPPHVVLILTQPK